MECRGNDPVNPCPQDLGQGIRFKTAQDTGVTTPCHQVPVVKIGTTTHGIVFHELEWRSIDRGIGEKSHPVVFGIRQTERYIGQKDLAQCFQQVGALFLDPLNCQIQF